MTTNYKKLVAIWAVLGMSLGAYAQEAGGTNRSLTLKEAIALALQQQPNLKSAQAQANAARQGLVQARAAYFPTVSLNYTTNDSYQSNAQSITGSGASTTTALTTSTRDGDVVVSYQLLDSGQRKANEQSARANFKASTFAAEDERQLTIANAANAYYALLRQEALVSVQKANVDRAQATLDMTKEQASKGSLAKKDVYQAEADLANAKVSLLDAQNAQGVAVAELKQTLGIASAETIEPVDHPTTTDVGAPLPLDNLLQTAYGTRPDVQQAVQNVEREKANVRYANAANGLSVSVDTNLSAAFSPSSGNSRAIGLTASLPIFNAGSNRAAVSQARETQKSVEAQLAAKKLSVAVEVETALRNLQTARASVPAALTAQEAAQINYDAATESRKEGIGTVVDVITAQSQLVEAQTNYVQALYNLYIADVSLQRAVGRADAIVSTANTISGGQR